jgi:hypothetical protein
LTLDPTDTAAGGKKKNFKIKKVESHESERTERSATFEKKKKKDNQLHIKNKTICAKSSLA